MKTTSLQEFMPPGQFVGMHPCYADYLPADHQATVAATLRRAGRSLFDRGADYVGGHRKQVAS